MTQKSKSRNADFILIAREGDTTTLGVKPRQPSPLNPLNLLNPLNPGPHSGPFLMLFRCEAVGIVVI